MPESVVNIQKKLAMINQYWSPKICAQVNDYHIKLVKLKGDFLWHSHTDTDEVFFVLRGKMVIYFRSGKVELNEGELYVVPKGVEHKPSADEECHILLIEPEGTVNTGNAGGDRTVPNNQWI